MLYKDAKTEIIYRANTFDKWIINESKGYFPLGLKDDDVILDLGGHIGCFGARAMIENKKVISVSIEPENSNYHILQMNAKKFDFDCLQGAIVDDDFDRQEMTLFVNIKKNNALHSIVPVRGRIEQKTTGIGFRRMLLEYNPTIIKCDIEGGEYQLPWTALTDSRVRLVIMELHLTHTGHRVQAKMMIGQFINLKFTVVRYPVINEKNWTCLAIWEKKQ